jgi:hypothetical protein
MGENIFRYLINFINILMFLNLFILFQIIFFISKPDIYDFLLKLLKNKFGDYFYFLVQNSTVFIFTLPTFLFFKIILLFNVSTSQNDIDVENRTIRYYLFVLILYLILVSIIYFALSAEVKF